MRRNSRAAAGGRPRRHRRRLPREQQHRPILGRPVVRARDPTATSAKSPGGFPRLPTRARLPAVPAEERTRKGVGSRREGGHHHWGTALRVLVQRGQGVLPGQLRRIVQQSSFPRGGDAAESLESWESWHPRASLLQALRLFLPRGLSRLPRLPGFQGLPGATHSGGAEGRQREREKDRKDRTDFCCPSPFTPHHHPRPTATAREPRQKARPETEPVPCPHWTRTRGSNGVGRKGVRAGRGLRVAPGNGLGRGRR